MPDHQTEQADPVPHTENLTNGLSFGNPGEILAPGFMREREGSGEVCGNAWGFFIHHGRGSSNFTGSPDLLLYAKSWAFSNDLPGIFIQNDGRTVIAS